MLSATVPRMAATTEITSHERGSTPPEKQTVLTITAAAMPAKVPISVTPPFVPAGTDFQVVINKAFPTEGLSQFARDGVGSGLGERGRHSEQEDQITGAKSRRTHGINRGANGRYTEIRDDLRGIPALSFFGHAKGLLALVADSRSYPGECEDRDQRGKCGGTASDEENEATNGSGKCAGIGDSAHPAGQCSEG